MPALSASERATRTQAPVIPIIGDLTRRVPGALSLGQGVVNYAPPPEAVEALTAFCDSGSPLYGPVNGDPELLDAIAAKLKQDNRIVLHSGNEVMVTAGANLAFANIALALLDKGDEALLPAPYYFNHEMAMTLAGAVPIPAPTTPERQLDLDRLEAAITSRCRAIVTVSPNNPTGAVYPEESLRAVNQLCARYGLIHIADEAYEYFTYDGAGHYSPASAPGAEAHTISIFSLSKSYGFAAHRIGYCVYPKSLDSAMRKIQDTLLICPPRASQAAATACLRVGAGYPRSHLAALEASRRTLGLGLETLGDRIEISPAQGAFYYFARLKTAVDDMEIAQRLVKDFGIAALPGSAFGDPAGPSLRLSYGAIHADQVHEATSRLRHGLEQLLD